MTSIANSGQPGRSPFIRPIKLAPTVPATPHNSVALKKLFAFSSKNFANGGPAHPPPAHPT